MAASAWLAQKSRKLGWCTCDIKAVCAHGLLTNSFLTATRPDYLESLSSASPASLRMQGGPFTPEEVEEFKKDPDHEEMMKLRLWDDRAKVVGLETPPLQHYKPMAERVLRRSLAV